MGTSEKVKAHREKLGLAPEAGTSNAGIIKASLSALYARDPDSVRKLLLQDEWLELGLTCLWNNLQRDDRSALRLYFEAIKMVGAEREVNTVIALVGDLGIKNLDELRVAVGAAKQVEGVGIEEAERRSLEFIQNQRRLRGEPLLIDPLLVPEAKAEVV